MGGEGSRLSGMHSIPSKKELKKQMQQQFMQRQAELNVGNRGSGPHKVVNPSPPRLSCCSGWLELLANMSPESVEKLLPKLLEHKTEGGYWMYALDQPAVVAILGDFLNEAARKTSPRVLEVTGFRARGRENGEGDGHGGRKGRGKLTRVRPRAVGLGLDQPVAAAQAQVQQGVRDGEDGTPTLPECKEEGGAGGPRRQEKDGCLPNIEDAPPVQQGSSPRGEEGHAAAVQCKAGQATEGSRRDVQDGEEAAVEGKGDEAPLVQSPRGVGDGPDSGIAVGATAHLQPRSVAVGATAHLHSSPAPSSAAAAAAGSEPPLVPTPPASVDAATSGAPGPSAAVDSSSSSSSSCSSLAEKLFQRFDAKGRGRVNALEIVAALFLLAGEGRPFQMAEAAREDPALRGHLRRLVALFDFDGGGALNEVAVEAMWECAVRGLSRLCGVALAEDLNDELALLVQQLFRETKHVYGVDSIASSILVEWMLTNPFVRSCLLHFTHARLIVSAQLEFQRRMQEAASLFHTATKEEGGEVSFQRVRQILLQLETHSPRNEDMDTFLTMVGSSDELGGDDLISQKEFDGGISAWLSYGVLSDTDAIHADLRCSDVKALLWLTEGTKTAEPSDILVKRAVDEIDQDKSGTISRGEWVLYSCHFNPNTGKLSFANDLLSLFNQYDDDNSGTMTDMEMALLVENALNEKVQELAVKGFEVRKGFAVILEQFAKDTSLTLLSVMDASRTGTVQWSEFKAHQAFLVQKLSDLHQYVEEVAVERVPSSSSSSNGHSSSSSRKRGKKGGLGDRRKLTVKLGPKQRLLKL